MLRGVTALLIVLAAGFAAPAGTAAGPIRTAIFDPMALNAQGTQANAFDRVRASGAQMVRLSLHWPSIAPRQLPPGFNATDPRSPHYTWDWFDTQVRLAKSRGLEPFVDAAFAPVWAGGPEGILRPDPVAFGQFMRAAAIRYSGSFSPGPGQPPLPRIRYWQAWGEPNRDYFLMPQYENGRIWAAEHYRALVNQLADNVWAVNPSNRVIAGSLSPYARQGKPAPLAFMRAMFCLTKSLHRACDLRSNPVRFDVWGHHPYTYGGPTHSAGRDNVALGDLPRMRRVLRAAIRLGHVRSHGRVPFWVTELSWDSSPPDPKALPEGIRARWVAEAIYRLWGNNVSVVTWWRIQDDPIATSRYQSGFWAENGRPKRSLTAFRFPVVAFKRAGGVYVWGRTPRSRPGRIVVELKTGGGWRRLGVTRANGHGIFNRTFRAYTRRGYVRARFGGAKSLPFALSGVRDRYVDPFGCGGPAAPC